MKLNITLFFIVGIKSASWCLLQERVCRIEWRRKEGKGEATDQFYAPVIL